MLRGGLVRVLGCGFGVDRAFGCVRNLCCSLAKDVLLFDLGFAGPFQLLFSADFLYDMQQAM